MDKLEAAVELTEAVIEKLVQPTWVRTNPDNPEGMSSQVKQVGAMIGEMFTAIYSAMAAVAEEDDEEEEDEDEEE
jgi:hypothetical protein